MGIDFNAGEITATPHVVAPQERFRFPTELGHGDVAYTEMASWLADANDQMWLSSTASMYSENDVETMGESDSCMTKEAEMIDEDNLCRVICIELTHPDSGDPIVGFILDCSAKNFTFGEDDAVNKLTRMDMAYGTIEHAAMDGFLPIFGWIRNEAELEAAEPILEKYGIKLEESILETVNDDELE